MYEPSRDPDPFDWSARSHPEVRQRTEEREEQLSKFAARSRESPDRDHPEEPDPMRTAYQIDRDRVIHSKAFRRLKHKTQVFIAPVGDHYRTRLTHTMEVMQVARSIARGLNLNEDLTEAIALGHDLGHTPFGHAGEYALGACLANGFRHNEQSVRVVEVLEKDGRGLNLTQEVRDGILRHSKLRESIAAEGWGIAASLEGQIVKIADSLAYLNHDIDDAIRAGVMSVDELPARANEVFGQTSGSRITAFVTDVVDFNWRVATGEGNTWREAVGNGIAIGIGPPVPEGVDELHRHSAPHFRGRGVLRSPARDRPVSSVTDEIKSRVDLVELIGRTVRLKRVGSQYSGLCPFHVEKTPSFYVRPQTQSWHCFGCNKSGTAFDWLMEREHLEFGEALRTLATLTGVTLPEHRDPEVEDQARSLYTILERAQTFYEGLLWGSTAMRARDYLAGRGLANETVKAFGMGYAPSGNGLLRYLEHDGFTEQELQGAGVISVSDEGL